MASPISPLPRTFAAALLFLSLPLSLLSEDLSPDQPTPEKMAEAAGVTLPHSPWHVANIWWDFAAPVEHFEKLEIEVEIDRDIPSTYNLYIAPVGIAKINGLDFYGGLQSNINGWPSKESRERVHPGAGAIFSRWSSDKKTKLSLEHVRMAADGLCESAGYEGEFCSVRRPFTWTKGQYIYRVVKGDSEERDGQAHTWFRCEVENVATGQSVEVGQLRFEGTDFTYWPRHSAFVEVYSTAKIPHSGIPAVKVSFGYPRINGNAPALKKASAFYPDKEPQAGPDCAQITAAGDRCVVTVGPIFKRDESQRRHPLELTAPVL